MTSFSYDRNPWVWRIAGSAFFATIIVNITLLFVQLQLSWTVNSLVSLLLILGFGPGFYGALREFGRVDTKKKAGRIIAEVMGGVFLIFIFFGVLRSINNMAGVFGQGIPFYSLLREALRVMFLAASTVFVASALIIRKYKITTNFEEPPNQIHVKWTMGGIVMMAGVILIGAGLLVAQVDPLAFEGLIATVLGLVAFPVGWLIRKRSKKRNMPPLA